MPMTSALTFASALTLTLQFMIFVYLYSFHRARFFHYLLLAWGLMSLAKGLHLARAFVPDLDVLSALINATFFVATLLVLAGGLAFRTDYRIGLRDVMIGAQQDDVRNLDAQGACRLEVYYQFEGRRQLDGHRCRVGAFQDPVDVAGEVTIGRTHVRTHRASRSRCTPG